MLVKILYLILIHQSSLVVSRSAFYFSNRSPPTLRRSGPGGYEPQTTTPEPESMVVYSFSPLGDEDLQRYGHRNTRDTDLPTDSEEDRRLIQRLNDPLNNKEPTCEELRKMWKLARKLQRRGSQANPSLFYSSPSKELNKEESDALLLGGSPKKTMKTDRRRLSVIPSRGSMQREEEVEEENNTEDQVYGRVSHFPSSNNVKVIDPTHDIINILRSRKERQINNLKSLRMRSNEVPHYGNIRYADNSPKTSYLDELRNALMEDKGLKPQEEPPQEAGADEEDSYDGSLVHREPSTPGSPRHFDILRLQLLAKEKENEREKLAAFETIKNSLLSSRMRQRIVNEKARKGLRRKNSRRRRKNLKQLMNLREAELRREYLWNLYERFSDNLEKKRRNRRNRKNGRHRNYKRTFDEDEVDELRTME